MVKFFLNAEIMNEFLEKEHILVDANKSIINDPFLEQTSIILVENGHLAISPYD